MKIDSNITKMIVVENSVRQTSITATTYDLQEKYLTVH